MISKKQLKKIEGEISLHEKQEYLHRLSKIYSDKARREKMFFEQYRNGSGSELDSHFWSLISSSRIAFDTYSCLVNETDDFEVEYKLPGIKSGNNEAHPNMDVFYRSNNVIYFVESKFSESPSENLPEAYYKTTDSFKSGEKIINKSLTDRYKGHQDIGYAFSNFYNNFYPKTKSKNDWFDYKQEFCHLVGIVFFAIEKCPLSVTKIDFKNIVFDFEEYSELGEKHISNTALDFIKNSEIMVNKLIKSNGKNISFTYGYDFSQKVINKNLKKEAFGLENKTVEDTLKPYLELLSLKNWKEE